MVCYVMCHENTHSCPSHGLKEQLTNDTMQLFYFQYAIQKKTVLIPALNGVLCDMDQVHCWICYVNLLNEGWSKGMVVYLVV